MTTNTKDSDDYVEDEVPTVDGMTLTFEWTPIIPGTFKLKMGRNVFNDDRKGRVTGVGRIDYEKGTVKLRFTPKVKVSACYRFNTGEATMTGEQTFEKVRDFMDNEVRALPRSEYKDFLERMADQIQCYLDCFEEEEKNARASGSDAG